MQERAYIFGSVFTLSNKLQSLGDKFDSNLTVKQWLLLAGIFKNGDIAPTITDVAELIGSSRQNVKKMVLILEKQGFIALNKDQNDARALRISLTEKCIHYLRLREENEAIFLEKLFNGFSSDELKSLARGMSKLGDNIIEMEMQYTNENNTR